MKIAQGKLYRSIINRTSIIYRNNVKKQSAATDCFNKKTFNYRDSIMKGAICEYGTFVQRFSLEML